jgi:undecaprenyl diphosphate synthase
MNYGSRTETRGRRSRAIAQPRALGASLPQRRSTEAGHFEEHRLLTHGLPDPDLLIRTAGERRISNFLLWQISYAELFVANTLWPDFGPSELHEALRDYASRQRRFGDVGEPAKT